MQFVDRLAAAVAARRSQVVLGLDPDPAQLWPSAVEAAAAGPPAGRAAAAVVGHCRAVIEAAGGSCVATKLQLACFERLGAPGWWALGEVLGCARSAGLLVIADGKRGDVPVTAAAYGQGLFGETSSPFGPIQGLGADAATANPLLGGDALQPLLDAAAAADAGIFILVRTSNPGAADFQDLELRLGGTLSERIAAYVRARGDDRLGTCGLADVGAVVGATVPGQLARLRELMPRTVFLLPGVGAQGGRVEELAAAWAPGAEAGLISSSRSITDAYRSAGGDPGAAAAAEAERLRRTAWKRFSAGDPRV